MDKKIKRLLAVGIFTSLVGLSHAEESSRFAFGPVERLSSRTITVLGQNYSLSGASPRNQLSIGTLVLVEGVTARDGIANARSIKVAKAPYVPGASDVALSGIVSHYDPQTGFLTVGNLAVYVTDATLANPVELAQGSEVEIIGRQAVASAALWATEIRVVADSIEGTGKGAHSTRAGGRTSQSIEGTGLTIQSIEGTGRSAQSIEGTGLSTQSIEGTGRSTLSIEGTGRTIQSIEGTGKSLQSIEGTGLSTQSIEGTGRSTLSIEGTGRTIQSIEGTGKGVQSIEGTGRSAQSIEGTGLHAQSIEGTGRSAT